MSATTKTPTTAANRDERVEAAADLAEICGRIADAVSCAESCETDADMDANLDDAIAAAEEFLKLAKAARSC